MTNQEPQKCLLRSACSEVPALKEHNIIIDNNKTEINKNKKRKECFKEYKEKNDEFKKFYSSHQDLINAKKSFASVFHIT